MDSAPRSGLYRWILVLGLVLVPAPLFALISLSFHSIPGSVSLTGGGTLSNRDVELWQRVGVRAVEHRREPNGRGLELHTLHELRGPRHKTSQFEPRLHVAVRACRARNALTWRVDGVTMSTSCCDCCDIAAVRDHGSPHARVRRAVHPRGWAGHDRPGGHSHCELNCEHASR